MALSFPTGDDSGGRPFVYFRSKDPEHHIFLPIPAGVVFSDGANFSSIDLGMIGGAIASALSNPDGIIDSMKNAGKETAKFLKNAKVGEMSAFALSTIIPDADKKEALMLASKRIGNPNTRTTYQGNKVRSYSFEFVLVGRSKADSLRITEIHNTFREMLYPEAEGPYNMIIKYPTTWEIQFFEGNSQNGAANPWIPITAPCYLTSLTTNFNPGGHMYRVDGSPTEIQLSLEFTETHSLIRDEIKLLNRKGL